MNFTQLWLPAPTASRSGDGARSDPQRPSRWCPRSSRTVPETARGSVHGENSPPAREDRPAAGPTGHAQLATSYKLLQNQSQPSYPDTPCGPPERPLKAFDRQTDPSLATDLKLDAV